GSFATYGRGKCLVTSIGMKTELGKIADLLNNTKDKKTPLQVSLDKFGKVLSYIIIGICAILFMLSIWRGESIVDAFVFAVALAVAAIPEALSSIITIMLSIGTQKLAKENAIIRKLQAVEALGSVSVICSDKTGTLTQNKMTVQHFYVDGIIKDKSEELTEIEKKVISNSILCNDSTVIDGEAIGDPTETALVSIGADKGIFMDVRTKYPRIGEIPFDSDRKIMSVVCQMEDGLWMVSKGAVDALLPKITDIETKQGIRSITKEDVDGIQKANRTFSESGLRVLAICEKNVPHHNVGTQHEVEYTFLGLMAMQDPPRVEAKDAVAKCISAGIRPVMITGDHLITAAAIAKNIGILTDDRKAIEGADIEHLTETELDQLVPQVAVYARVTPEHKIRIVDSWQRQGYIVAMTGDGVNDAPALKQADIGVAMGITGSEVAKDSAAMVLADDNFATIVKAVEYGRNLYANIQRALQFLLSGNTAGILVVLYASVINLPVPFRAVHLLFINLLTDSLPAIALGLEPYSEHVMKDKPRSKDSSILSKKVLVSIGIEGLIIGITTVAAFYIGLKTNVETARTMAFATLCLARLVHGFNCKSEEPILGSKKLWNNKALIGAFAVGTCLMTLVLVAPPLHHVFDVVTLNGMQYAAVYGLAFSNLIFIQIRKLINKLLNR
ncbi:MAG: cation-translocating P-type ATPase, partial [Lachnospiraceae bacterium]